MNRCLLLTLMALLFYAPSLLAQPFTDMSHILPGDEDATVMTMAPADYDSDGDYDLFVRSVIWNAQEQGAYRRFEALQNDGSSDEWSFSQVVLDDYDSEIDDPFDIWMGNELTVADYDNDGDLDVFLGEAGTPSRILVNDEGAFSEGQQLPEYFELWGGFDINTASWADYDNDGDLDLLIPNAVTDGTSAIDCDRDLGLCTHNAALFRNDQGTLVESGVSLPAVIVGQTEWGDYDNDGDLDLILFQSGPGRYFMDMAFTRLYRNESGTLVDMNAALPVLYGGTVDWTDFDNDGDLDVVAAGDSVDYEGQTVFGTYPVVRVMRNDEGSFIRTNPLVDEIDFDGVNGAAWADYDGDGDTDALISMFNRGSNSAPAVSRIYRNEAGVLVSTEHELPGPDEAGGVFLWADFDNDGDLDHAVSGLFPTGPTSSRWNVFLYRNDSPGTNVAPSTPSGLSASVSGNRVELAWNPAGDDHTPSAGLTYNLWVQQRLGSDIVSPMSRSNGTRLLPEPGNVSHNTAWTYTLPPGEYTWRVQAVDNAFNGGAFAEGGSFTVGAVDAEDEAAAPTVFAVQGAFPNPLRRAGALHLNLPEKAEVSVALYDVLGREVLRTVPEAMEAGSGLTLGLDASGLPSGMYVWRVEAVLSSGTQQASGRLTVVH